VVASLRLRSAKSPVRVLIREIAAGPLVHLGEQRR
jgi:hypothetical protein